MKMIRSICAVAILFTIAFEGSLLAQTAAKPAFEVATIKPARPLMEMIADIQSGKIAVAGLVQALQPNIDGVRADFGYFPLNSMLLYAFKLKQYQISGPEWLSSQAFEIHARIPEGGTKEQVPEMMQSLLAERFKLVSHRENKEQPVYALIVSKDGHKLKEAPADQAPADETGKNPIGKDGSDKNAAVIKTSEGDVKIKQQNNGMVMSVGKTGQQVRMNMGPNGTMSMEISKTTMPEFCELLNQFLDRPVMDLTELKGAYQVALEIPLQELLSLAKKTIPGLPIPAGTGNSGIAGAAPGAGGPAASEPSGTSVFQAVQKLGLKLDSRKMPLETLIIDQIEKVPTED
jgi:uncharacterized protein (TIGR03435 family)